jgi:hypothetical protein
MTKKNEIDAMGCLFFIATAFVIVGAIWAFGAYGMIAVGVAILALVFWIVLHQ